MNMMLDVANGHVMAGKIHSSEGDRCSVSHYTLYSTSRQVSCQSLHITQ